MRSAIDAGYDKALLTIIDSHVTTLITGVALFLLGPDRSRIRRDAVLRHRDQSLYGIGRDESDF